MNDKHFIRNFFILLILLTLITAGHMVFAAYAYERSSIIAYVASEVW